MKECENLATCPFVTYSNENSSTTSLNGFINMFCKGSKQESCIRKQLCEKFSRSIVPKNMMPNGYPLPGSKRDGWSEEAVNYRKLLA